MVHHKDHNRIRPNIYVDSSSIDWTKRDTTTDYSVQLFSDIERKKPIDLTGGQIWMIISTDFPYKEEFLIEVTAKKTDDLNGRVQTKFALQEINKNGEFKIEFFTGSLTNRNYSHHIDFNVVE